MHVGFGPVLQNPANALPDAAVSRQKLRLTEAAELPGCDSRWSAEHRFTDYTMCADIVQFFPYITGKTQCVQLAR